MRAINRFISKVTLFILLITLFGCTTSGLIKHSTETTYPDGSITRSVTRILAPNYSIGDSYYTFDSNGVYCALSGAQDQATIRKVDGVNKNYRILFWLGGISMILGLIIWRMDNKMFPNGVGTGAIIAGAACLAVGIIAPTMAKFALPIIVVILLAVGGWLGYKAYIGRETPLKHTSV
jgi:hypothetical protein